MRFDEDPILSLRQLILCSTLTVISYLFVAWFNKTLNPLEIPKEGVISFAACCALFWLIPIINNATKD